MKAKTATPSKAKTWSRRPPPPPGFITPIEAGEILGRSSLTVVRLGRRGVLTINQPLPQMPIYFCIKEVHELARRLGIEVKSEELKT